MTQTGYSNAIVNVMLGWLKGLATWVLKLFNLAGSGGNPLGWLSDNWLKLLIVLLLVGVAMDWLIWMVRWRPYWVWFKKKRIVINDEKFLAGEELEDIDTGDVDDEFERDYVVPSTVVRRTAPRKTTAVAKSRSNRGRTPSTVVARRPQQSAASRKTQQSTAARKPVHKDVRRHERRDIFEDEFFEVGNSRTSEADFYEDEVFNVSNLPDAPDSEKRARKKRR